MQRGQATAKYKLNHLLREKVTCPALPNNVWFNLGLANIVEADVRTQSYTSLKLNDLENKELMFNNCFDVCPVGGDAIAVGGSNKVRFYDRRMLTPTPYKVIDLRPLSDMDLVVTKLKYHPSGRKILIAVSTGFQDFMSDMSETGVENMRSFEFRDVPGTVLRNPNFLGSEGRYVMFDTFSKDFVVVFDSRDFRCLGKFQAQPGSDTESCPQVIAIAQQDVVHFVTPTSSTSQKV